MINKNLENLIDGINHISLNHEDLMDTVLDFAKLYCKNNPSDAAVIDKFFIYGTFLDQAVMAARESIVLAMNAITLDENIDFNLLIERCVNLEHQRQAEEDICADDETKLLMQQFLKGLRTELFSRLYSQNKEFVRFTKINKSVLEKRFDLFMNQKF